MNTASVASPEAPASPPLGFFAELAEQRWDDHRLYHQSRVNQALHLFSACCFLVTYAWLFIDPAAASVFGWIVPMWVRQIGHFFFEPRGFDQVNQATFEHKELVKVGFNLQRKVMLLAAWLAVPVGFALSPTMGGLVAPWEGWRGLLDRVGLCWLGLAFVGLFGRVGYLVVARSPRTGLAWLTKIVTDPFHDISMYYRSPLHLLRGQWLDPMDHVTHRAP